MMKTQSLLTLVLTLGLCAGATEAKGNCQKGKRDTNNDGIVSLDEFMANRKNADRAKARFEKVDTNHDSQIDKAERAAMKEQRQKGQKHRGQKKADG